MNVTGWVGFVGGPRKPQDFKGRFEDKGQIKRRGSVDRKIKTAGERMRK